MTIHERTIESPVGALRLEASDTGLRAIHWEGPRSVPAADDHPVLDAAEQQLEEYFAGERRDFDLPLDLDGTPFQVAAWRALADIGYGETVSYAAQAASLGRPRAFRAVGSANGRNPVPIVLPCHRVIASDGTLGGYGGGEGLETKQWLLDHERRGDTLFAGSSLGSLRSSA